MNALALRNQGVVDPDGFEEPLAIAEAILFEKMDELEDVIASIYRFRVVGAEGIAAALDHGEINAVTCIRERRNLPHEILAEFGIVQRSNRETPATVGSEVWKHDIGDLSYNSIDESWSEAMAGIPVPIAALQNIPDGFINYPLNEFARHAVDAAIKRNAVTIIPAAIIESDLDDVLRRGRVQARALRQAANESLTALRALSQDERYIEFTGAFLAAPDLAGGHRIMRDAMDQAEADLRAALDEVWGAQERRLERAAAIEGDQPA
jgi:hypothetical protein